MLTIAEVVEFQNEIISIKLFVLKKIEPVIQKRIIAYEKYLQTKKSADWNECVLLYEKHEDFQKLWESLNDVRLVAESLSSEYQSALKNRVSLI